MSGYARIRPEYLEEGRPTTWLSVEIRDLEGRELNWAPNAEWVKAVCFDAMQSGLYVLTDDDDYYFTCHSLYLEYRDTLPNERIENGQARIAV